MDLNKFFLTCINFGTNNEYKLINAESKDEALITVKDYYGSQFIFLLISISDLLKFRDELDLEQNQNCCYIFMPIINEDEFIPNVIKEVTSDDIVLEKYKDIECLIYKNDSLKNFLDMLILSLETMNENDLLI